METLRIALRLIHIFSGTLWVGAAIFVTLMLEPAARAAGVEGSRFMERLMAKTPFIKYMIGSSLLTVLAGITLYGLDAGFNRGWVTSAEGLTFSLGSLSGLLAYAAGQFVIGPTTARIGRLGHEMARAATPPTSAQRQQMAALESRVRTFGRLELLLMVLTVAGMAGARLF
jgi:uncharacterized membrane protein